MAVYDLEEQEQLAEVKAWWKQHGNLVTNALLAVAVVAAGWQGWTWYQRSQAAQASTVFHVLQRAVGEKDQQKVKAATGEVLEKFGGTAYAPMAAMIAGKSAFDAGDLKTARVQLAWAVDHATDGLKDLARLRFAAVLLDDKAFDEALKQLTKPDTPSFAALFAETRGDILVAQGKPGEAAAAYREALAGGNGDSAAALTGRSAFRELVQQKIESFGQF